MGKRPTTQLVLAPIVSAIIGAAAGVLINGSQAQARIQEPCPNVYCQAGGSSCPEMSNWWCQLDGGCSGFGRCPIQP
jgi:hypothetical protein